MQIRFGRGQFGVLAIFRPSTKQQKSSLFIPYGKMGAFKWITLSDRKMTNDQSDVEAKPMKWHYKNCTMLPVWNYPTAIRMNRKKEKKMMMMEMREKKREQIKKTINWCDIFVWAQFITASPDWCNRRCRPPFIVWISQLHSMWSVWLSLTFLVSFWHDDAAVAVRLALVEILINFEWLWFVMRIAHFKSNK